MRRPRVRDSTNSCSRSGPTDIPVYPVGVGEPVHQRDLEIARVNLPQRVLNGSRVTAEVTLRQQGYDGEKSN